MFISPVYAIHIFGGGGGGCSAVGCSYSASDWMTFLESWGVSGSITDEQLVCAETTAGTNLLKSCGAKITYTEPGSNLPLCRTGASTTGACTNIVIEKIATFHWGDGINAVGTTGTKVCADAPFSATLTGIKLSSEVSPTSDVTVTLVKDAQASGATANATTAFNVISSSNVVTIAGAGSGLATIYTTLTASTVTAGDQICATVTATDTTKWLHLTLYGTR